MEPKEVKITSLEDVILEIFALDGVRIVTSGEPFLRLFRRLALSRSDKTWNERGWHREVSSFAFATQEVLPGYGNTMEFLEGHPLSRMEATVLKEVAHFNIYQAGVLIFSIGKDKDFFEGEECWRWLHRVTGQYARRKVRCDLAGKVGGSLASYASLELGMIRNPVQLDPTLYYVEGSSFFPGKKGGYVLARENGKFAISQTCTSGTYKVHREAETVKFIHLVSPYEVEVMK